MRRDPEVTVPKPSLQGTTVTEAQIKANADAMADKLMRFGWRYSVVDIQWYAAAAAGHEYRPGTAAHARGPPQAACKCAVSGDAIAVAMIGGHELLRAGLCLWPR
jgi:hypothetical protein